MNSSVPAPVSPDVSVGQVCHFMRLPTEVRLMIYRYLLIARYTVREHNMTSKEYDSYRSSIQDGPDQTYDFHTAILATNRTIYEEATDLCQRENDFVCLSSQEPSRLGDEMEKAGLQMIASRWSDCGIWSSSMSLTLDPPRLDGWPQMGWPDESDEDDAPEDEEPWAYMFCSDELPEFCRILLHVCQDFEADLPSTTLYVDIDPALGNGQVFVTGCNSPGWARIQKLIQPLRQLHSFGAAQITGPLRGSVQAELISSVCKPCPTAFDIIDSTTIVLQDADEKLRKGKFREAITGYKTAHSCIRSCWWRYDEVKRIRSEGPHPGLDADQVVRNLKVRLQARIAAAYLENGQPRMARIYTERALDPRRTYDDRHWKTKKVELEPWENVVYSEVFHVAAKISYTHGNVGEAVRELEQAKELSPFNEDQKSRHGLWAAHAERLQARARSQYEAKKALCEKREIKAEGILQQISNKKKKGDSLLQSGRSILATSTFQHALRRLESLDHDHDLDFTIKAHAFKDYLAQDALKALRFKLQASLAAAYLMSRIYKEVNELAAWALECNCERHSGPCHHHYSSSCLPSSTLDSDKKNFAEDQKSDYHLFHYCNGIALKEMGDTQGAIEHLEKALSLNPGDDMTQDELVELRQKQKQEQEQADALAREKERLAVLNAVTKTADVEASETQEQGPSLVTVHFYP